MAKRAIDVGHSSNSFWAAKNIDKIEPQDCYNWIKKRYTFDRVGLMYEEYFQSLLNLNSKVQKGKGWNSLNPKEKI